MVRIAADPEDLLRYAQAGRETALAYAGEASRLRSVALPRMPASLAGFVTGATGDVASRLSRIGDELLESAEASETAARWFFLAGEGKSGGLEAFLASFASSLGSSELTSSTGPASGGWQLEDWLGLEDLSTASPDEVAAAFEGLSGAQKGFLVESYPDAIGPLGGAPFSLRFEANRLLIDRTIAELEGHVAVVEARMDALRATLAENLPDVAPGTYYKPTHLGDEAMEMLQLDRELDALNEKLAAIAPLAEGERRFLLFDPSGDGRVAEVFGPIQRADHIALVVPGMANDMGNFSGPAGNARMLLEEASRYSPREVATIAWLGYDTPTFKDVLFADKAVAGAALLEDFVAGLNFADRVHVTGVAHSYGGVVQGLSLRDGLGIDEAIFIGNPGVGPHIDHVGDLDTSARIWAAKAPLYRPDGPEVDDIAALLRGAPLEAAVDEFVETIKTSEFVPLGPLGKSPAADDFGAYRFHTDAEGSDVEVRGHSEYFRRGSESLRNMGKIVAGNPDAVSTY